MKACLCLLIYVLLFGMMPSVAAHFWQGADHRDYSYPVAQMSANTVGSSVSMHDAAIAVKQHTGGRLLKATKKNHASGFTVYHIRILSPSGKIKTYQVDSRSGEIMQ